MTTSPPSADHARRKNVKALSPLFNSLELIILCGAAFAAASLFAGHAAGLPLDDAYIHLVFAKNLAGGRGFCFNPGEFSLGFSSPLWVMLLALAQKAGADLVRAALFIGQAFFAASVIILYDLVRISVKTKGAESDSSPSSWPVRTGFAAAIAMVTCGNLLWLAGAGMEASMFLFLGLLAILLLRTDRPKPIAGGIVLGLLLLTRSTGVALWMIFVITALASQKSRRPLAAAGVIALALAAPWHLYSFFKTGFLLPSTMAGKLASNLFNAGPFLKGMAVFTGRNINFLAGADPQIIAFIALAAAAAIALLMMKRKSRAARDAVETRSFAAVVAGRIGGWSPAAVLAAWALMHFAMHSILFRPAEKVAAYNNLRYQIMLFPAAIAAAALALSWLGARLSARAPKRTALLPAAVVCALLAPALYGLLNMGFWHRSYQLQTEQLHKVHRAAAVWIKNHTPADARVAALDIGILRFYSGRHVIDLGGLTDPSILPCLEEHRVGPCLIKKRATRLLALENYPSETITGAKADQGRLYDLEALAEFNYPWFPEPVFLHSRGIEIFQIIPLPESRSRGKN